MDLAYLFVSILICCCIHRRKYSDRMYLRCCPVRARI